MNINKHLKSFWHSAIPTFWAVLVGLTAADRLNAQNYGIHFLGNTADPVTSTAGVVPIPRWNNISSSFTSGTISSSDGSATATLSMSSAWPGDGGWNSGITGDGANFSLMHGFWDAGNQTSPATGTATISGLPNGQLFNVYLYTFSDQAKPNFAGADLPNYSVNGTIDYVPVLGVQPTTDTTEDNYGANGFTGIFIPATSTNVNFFQELEVPAGFGNYLVISNVTPVGGVITFQPEADTSSYRSPLNGIEIVPNDSSASFGVHFLGNTSDNVTSTAGVVPIGDWNNVANTAASTAITGSDGSSTATLTLAGSMAGNSWSSGLPGDGANYSLYDGFWDAGNYNDSSPAPATISGLTASSYTVYLYTLSDSVKPGVDSPPEGLPNYSVNGTTYYFPVLGVSGTAWTTIASVGGYGFAGFVEGTTANANNNNPPAPASFGNYIVLSNVAPVSGAITIGPEADGTSFRSPLNGIEIVPNDSSASFGVHFLGNTSDNVTSTAGVVPIGDWANIAPGAGSSSITGSDGSTTATLTLAGGQAGNAWNSGVTGDGANLSLMHGFMDAGNYGGSSATATISGLTASSYTVYVYDMSDTARPGNNGDWLPNYSVNGTIYYVPVLGGNNSSQYISTGEVGGDPTGFVMGTTTNANTSQPVPISTFGNYIEYSKVAATGGQITVQVEPDGTSYRSPLNGIELVAISAPTISIQMSGSNVVLTWSGTLLEATSVTGPWTTNNATSPFTNGPTAPQMFYRAVQ